MKCRHVFTFGLIAIVLFYLPTLWHGYYNDDFGLVSLSWKEWLANPFQFHGRPLWPLSFLLGNLISTSSCWHHGINIILFAGLGLLAAWLIKREKLPPFSYLFALAALYHPSMLWPVSWISQRNDLLLLVFLVPAFSLYSARSGIVWVLLSSLAKAPFLFQDLIFMVQYLRRKRYTDAVLAAIGFLVPLYYVWKSYYLGNVAAAGHGLFLVKGSGGIQSLIGVRSRISTISGRFQPAAGIAVQRHFDPHGVHLIAGQRFVAM